MATNKKQVGIRINPSIYDKLKTIAEKDGRTITNQVEFLVKSFIEKYETQHGQIPLGSNDGAGVVNQQIGNNVFVNSKQA